MSFPNPLTAVDNFRAVFHESHKYWAFDYIVDLAESGARTKVIATPAIFASQGETATIRSGDNEPIVQQTLQSGVVTATTIFKDIGLRLEVQPLLIGRDAIRARISTEVSRVSDFRITATSQDLQVVNPVISSRTADTVVTVPDGETLVLAGLESDITSDASTGIPLLKDIPFIGYAFGSKTKRSEHTEVVFFLTFTILRPGEARVVRPPSEEERIGK
jgi:general secretion pathway protein D